MLKALIVLGTRPEAIKMAPVVKALHARADRVTTRVCVTGQHREMLDQVLGIFHIHPDHDLNIMTDDQAPSRVAAEVLIRLEDVLHTEHPDWVLVQGDTTTAMAAGVAAAYTGVKLAHVEAGLRTGDRTQPFPEEINRRLLASLADLHLAPTRLAQQNLLREGVAPEAIAITGNPVIDALHWVIRQPTPPQALRLLQKLGLAGSDKHQQGRGRLSEAEHLVEPQAVESRLPASPASAHRRHVLSQSQGDLLQSSPNLAHGATSATTHRPPSIVDRRPAHLVLVTAHRRESFGAPQTDICQALCEIAATHTNAQIVYPVHPNPQVSEPVRRLLTGVPRIALLPPLDYASLAHLLRHTHLVLTDSGGLQEEAPSLGIPVLVLRQVTERQEGVDCGVARVVGTSARRIAAEAHRLLTDAVAYASMAQATNPYGDGRAAGRIASAVLGEPFVAFSAMAPGEEHK
jgi:UDP-N-acetylglucosamine 2-epimerase (non-hydrolysing)